MKRRPSMRPIVRALLTPVALGTLLFVLCCSPKQEEPETLVLATTTSTRDSGLLDALLPAFEQKTGIRVQVIAVGSGQALELGRRGDADVLLTHAPEGEEAFVAEGHAALRQPVMRNEFLVVGPPEDPSAVQGLGVVDALTRLRDRGAPFVSRGDDSGTHRRELRLWEAAGLRPGGEGYIEAGAGMADALRIAEEKRAYVLTDIATYLAHRTRLSLVPMVRDDPLLINPYSVMLVNPEVHPHVRAEAGRKFVEFLLAPDTQRRIAAFGRDRFGEPLFQTDERAGGP